jgi:hypothetical protein
MFELCKGYRTWEGKFVDLENCNLKDVTNLA